MALPRDRLTGVFSTETYGRVLVAYLGIVPFIQGIFVQLVGLETLHFLLGSATADRDAPTAANKKVLPQMLAAMKANGGNRWQTSEPGWDLNSKRRWARRLPTPGESTSAFYVGEVPRT